MFTGRIIDVHSHVYTRKFLKKLEQRSKFPVFRTNETGRKFIIFAEGVANEVPKSFVDIEHRIKVMDKHGVSTQLLSGTNPWTDSFPSGELAYSFSKLLNDDISEVVNKYRGRFLGLATLPVLSPADAAVELARARDDLGLCGAIVATNVRGTSLSDEEFLPIFDVASKKRCLVFLHPALPLGADKLNENGLARSIGYTFETTVCLVKMAYSGPFDKFPNLKLLSAHLAGAIPFLQGRIDTAWKNFKDSKGKLNEPPTTKICRVLFADTISYSAAALNLAIEFMGLDRLFFGTDYPFDWGIKEARDSIESTFAGRDEEIRKVYSENFQTVLGDIKP